jgi:Outer membrane protein beta-barrel domain
MTRSVARALLASLAALVLLPPPAAAQVDAAGGYANLHETDVNVPKGWFAAVGADIGRGLGIVGQISGNYATLVEDGADVSSNLHIFGAGPRFSAHVTPSVTPFGLVLLGVAQSNAHVIDAPETSVAQRDFAVQPAGGVDIAVSDRVGVRLQIAETFVRADEGTQKEFQFMSGIVLRSRRP